MPGLPEVGAPVPELLQLGAAEVRAAELGAEPKHRLQHQLPGVGVVPELPQLGAVVPELPQLGAVVPELPQLGAVVPELPQLGAAEVGAEPKRRR